MPPRGKMLDLRYNEMWNDWDGTEEPREPEKHVHGHLVLSWKRLNVSVKQTTQKFFKRSKTTYKQILHNVSGNVKCGTLLGIMGPSGSGKTTLMSTISHRTKGNFEGELLLNGRQIYEETMIKISGFVPQHDISFDQLTALEHVCLMANLKMDRKTTKEARKKHVDYIVSMLGMVKFLDTRILFLSGGERKKVALAVQMLNDPPILFCDEITTGLDSYSAMHIVNTLKGITRMGKIVVCTIHQPASGIFGKFDDVILLTNGRLAYQGPVSMVKQLFQRFDYKCPALYNESDFVISILNSDDENVKRNVEEMCKLSSTKQQTNTNYDMYNNENQINFKQNLQTKKPGWNLQFAWILDRSIKCFLRSFKIHLLELATFMALGFIIAAPYSHIAFDTKAVQNWEGFWFILTLNLIFNIIYCSISTYQVKFSIVHREVHNAVYPLSVYYLSELMIMSFWIMIKMTCHCTIAFWIVGAEWGLLGYIVFLLISLSAFSYGNMLSAYFSSVENAAIFAIIYDFIGMPLCGAYLSFQSLPIVLYYLRYFSLFFLGCETVSILFWEGIKSLQCIDVVNCLDSGNAVLKKYGFIREDFYFDLWLLVSFCVITHVLGYFGVLRRMKKQPAY